MARAQLTDEQIDALQAQHPDPLGVLETPKGTAVFRMPTRDEWLEFLKRQNSPKEAKGAQRWLAATCVVHPDEPTLHEWCNARVGIPSLAEDKLSELVGLDKAARAADSDDGDTTTVATVAGPITVKCPDERQFNAYKDRMGKDPQDAFEYLTQCCAVTPPREQQRALLDKYPGIAGTVVAHIHRISGLQESERGKE